VQIEKWQWISRKSCGFKNSEKLKFIGYLLERNDAMILPVIKLPGGTRIGSTAGNCHTTRCVLPTKEESACARLTGCIRHPPHLQMPARPRRNRLTAGRASLHSAVHTRLVAFVVNYNNTRVWAPGEEENCFPGKNDVQKSLRSVKYCSL
jgi:hypothetical protein